MTRVDDANRLNGRGIIVAWAAGARSALRGELTEADVRDALNVAFAKTAQSPSGDSQ